MWMSTEDARSDVILAAATAVFGVSVANLVARLPFYPRSGLVATLFNLLWLVALTGLVPYLLTRYRKMGPESYGLDAGRNGLSAGLLLAAPVIVVGVLRGLPLRDSLFQAVLGRFSPLIAGDPTISAEASAGANLLVDGIVALLWVGILSIGALLLYTFLAVRGRDAFSRRDLSATEAVRTFGMVSAASALVFGLLRSLSSDLSAVGVLITVVGLVVFILLGDRLVPAGVTTTRAAILTPVVVAVLAHVLQLLRGDLLFGLYAASVAGGIVAVLASIVEGRAFAWAIVPPIVAMAIYPTCLSVVPFGTAPFAC